MGALLSELFQVLDTKEPDRSPRLDEDVARFPYVNGDLFQGALRIPAFDAAMRNTLLDACRFDWSHISPAIFGGPVPVGNESGRSAVPKVPTTQRRRTS